MTTRSRGRPPPLQWYPPQTGVALGPQGPAQGRHSATLTNTPAYPSWGGSGRSDRPRWEPWAPPPPTTTVRKPPVHAAGVVRPRHHDGLRPSRRWGQRLGHCRCGTIPAGGASSVTRPPPTRPPRPADCPPLGQCSTRPWHAARHPRRGHGGHGGQAPAPRRRARPPAAPRRQSAAPRLRRSARPYPHPQPLRRGQRRRRRRKPPPPARSRPRGPACQVGRGTHHGEGPHCPRSRPQRQRAQRQSLPPSTGSCAPQAGRPAKHRSPHRAPTPLHSQEGPRLRRRRRWRQMAAGGQGGRGGRLAGPPPRRPTSPTRPQR